MRERLKRDLFQFNKVRCFPQNSRHMCARQMDPEPLQSVKGRKKYSSVGGKVKFRRGGLFSFSVLSLFPSPMCLTGFL